MTHYTRYSAASASAYHDDLDNEDDSETWLLQPEERIGPPARAGRGGALLSGGIAILIALAGAAALLDDRARPPPMAVAPANTAATPDRGQPAADLPVTTLPPPKDIAGSPDVGPAASETAAKVAAIDGRTPADGESGAPAGPLPPPSVDSSDPYQVRAAAVGLHPGLSRVLLMRLSADDYRNAGIAIRTALAETPDSDVYVWPRQRRAELARFQVHFVPGAAPPCRRYVVTVAKDGWATTALPLEKCVAQPGRARRD